MRTFEYEGHDQNGQSVKGFLDGLNAAHVEEQLIEQGTRITSVVEAGSWVRFARPGQEGLKPEEIVLLSDQLETIARNGLPLAPSIALLAIDAQSRRVRRILKNVQQTLESGGTLAAALAEGGAGLPSAILSLIRVGEQTGNLPAVLAQVSKHYGRLNDARNAIRQAAAYPVLLIVAACVLLGLMCSVIVPQFAGVYGSFGGRLPLATQILLDMSAAVTQLFSPDMLNIWVYILVFLLLVRLYFGLSLRGQMTYMRLQEWFRYKCPFFGHLYQVAVAERFSRVLGLLITNHALAPESLMLAGVASGSMRMAQSAKKASVLVKNGSRLSEALAAMHEFRASFLWIMSNAENQGDLGHTLLRLADAYEKEVERRANMVVALAAPVIITVIGIVIAAFIISIFMPILQLSSLVSV